MGSKKAKSVGISGGFAPTDLYCFRAVLYQPYSPIFYSSLNVIQPDVRVLKSAFREWVGVCPPAKSCRKGTLDSRANRTAYRPFPFWPVLTLLFEADMLFGNENRHLNNIAVLRRGEGFDYCPLFDFGAGLLSNTRDYPLDLSPAPTCGCTRFRWALLSADRSRPPGLFTALSWSGPLPPMTSPTRWPDRWSFMPSGTGSILSTG